ncbi:putative flavin-containing monooxygenase [Hyaloraphidium curvatum]|nr:putative flavin-containing monooxygenase [Hyaloraphidium curvatum]
MPPPKRVDVLVIGAGLSGVCMGYYLKTKLPGKTFVILEGREEMGGTWSLFKYPGIRSDSDMLTLGFSFKPWRGGKTLADGPSILSYIKETAAEFGIEEHIRYGSKVTSMSWNSSAAAWTVRTDGKGTFETPFVFSAAGYYDYDKGYLPPEWDLSSFKGKVIHPQFWPTDFDHSGKRITVIGSGATAVTLVPALAETASHVTMLQRSPTYVVSAPQKDPWAEFLTKWLPGWLSYRIVRWRRILFGMYFYNLAMRYPKQVADFILNAVRDALGPSYDVAKHFTPRYNPWQQRMCLIPDGDMFEAIKAGKASVVTDTIEAFVPEGIRLASGETLASDVIVTATGLRMNQMGAYKVDVDGRTVRPGDTLIYKGMMLSNVPNLAFAVGYTNASWTLKCELSCGHAVRLLRHMDSNGYSTVVPVPGEDVEPQDTFANFTSGYVQRAMKDMPKSGQRPPWRNYQNYLYDMVMLEWTGVANAALRFYKKGEVSVSV